MFEFSNVGQKIKDVARVFFVAAVVVHLILSATFFGLVLTTEIMDLLVAFIIFLVSLVVGPLLIWVSCLFIYGYGELIDKTSRIEEKLDEPLPHDLITPNL